MTKKSFFPLAREIATLTVHYTEFTQAIIKSNNFAVSRNGDLGSLKFSWFFLPKPLYCLHNVLAHSSISKRYLSPTLLPFMLMCRRICFYISKGSTNQLLLSFVAVTNGISHWNYNHFCVALGSTYSFVTSSHCVWIINMISSHIQTYVRTKTSKSNTILMYWIHDTIYDSKWIYRRMEEKNKIQLNTMQFNDRHTYSRVTWPKQNITTS